MASPDPAIAEVGTMIRDNYLSCSSLALVRLVRTAECKILRSVSTTTSTTILLQWQRGSRRVCPWFGKISDCYCCRDRQVDRGVASFSLRCYARLSRGG